MLGPGIDWPPLVSRTGGLPRLWRPTDEHEEHHITEPRINERIRVPEVRLVGPNGEQVGIVRVEDALRLAQEADLDLVEVAPEARPPVCKLMDFGKFKYEADMKAREARRNQANTVLKEIRFRLKIDPHDYGTKKGHVERFLKGGDKVKVMIMFRGREQSRPEMGLRLLRRLSDDVAELGFVESAPKQDGRNMIMVLGPVRKKAEAKHEQRRRAQDTGTANAPGVISATTPEELVAPAIVEVEVPQLETPVEAAVVETAVVETAVVEAPVVEPAVAEAKPVVAKAAPARAAVPKPATAAPAAAKRVAAKPAASKVVADAVPAAAPAAKPAPKPRATKATPAKDA